MLPSVTRERSSCPSVFAASARGRAISTTVWRGKRSAVRIAVVRFRCRLPRHPRRPILPLPVFPPHPLRSDSPRRPLPPPRVPRPHLPFRRSPAHDPLHGRLHRQPLHRNVPRLPRRYHPASSPRLRHRQPPPLESANDRRDQLRNRIRCLIHGTQRFCPMTTWATWGTPLQPRHKSPNVLKKAGQLQKIRITRGRLRRQWGRPQGPHSHES